MLKRIPEFTIKPPPSEYGLVARGENDNFPVRGRRHRHILASMDRTLVMENIPIEKGAAEVTELLKPLGTVCWVYLKSDEERNCQTAYVEMASEKEASRVIVKWNGAAWQDRILRIKYVEKNFDPARMAPGAGPRRAANSTAKQLFGARLDVRDLAALARAYKAKEELAGRELNLLTNTRGPRWYIIILVMLGLGALLYIWYRYSQMP
jgi:hypothetical protein